MIETVRAKAMPIWNMVKDTALDFWARAVDWYHQAMVVYQKYFDMLASLVGAQMAQRIIIGVATVLGLAILYFYIRFQTRPRDNFDFDDDYDAEVHAAPAE